VSRLRFEPRTSRLRLRSVYRTSRVASRQLKEPFRINIYCVTRDSSQNRTQVPLGTFPLPILSKSGICLHNATRFCIYPFSSFRVFACGQTGHPCTYLQLLCVCVCVNERESHSGSGLGLILRTPKREGNQNSVMYRAPESSQIYRYVN
jgi:hypothetical protein